MKNQDSIKKSNNHGGYRHGAGAKPKADAERIRDLISPYANEAIEKVVSIMRNAEKEADSLAAAKLLMAYLWGQPTQMTEVKDVTDRPTVIEIVKRSTNGN